MPKVKIYKTKDLVIPDMKFGKTANIKIIDDGESIVLCIGKRDIEWDKKTGELVGSGYSFA